MNVNDKIFAIQEIDGIGDIGIALDVYSGRKTRWIVFNYADERGVNFAEDTNQDEKCEMQVHLYTPLEEDYMELKEKIKKYLKTIASSDVRIRTLYEQEKKMRHLIFEFEMLEEEKEWQL